MQDIAISPLQLDPLTRDYWGNYDAWAIAQMAPLADNRCYRPKFYKAPATEDELIPAGGYAAYGLRITPGSLIFGFFLPGNVSGAIPPKYLVQITDTSLNHDFFDQPIPSYFLGNYQPTYLSNNPLDATGKIGSFPSLLCALHPVVGDGLFRVQIWDAAGLTTGPGGSSQRVELIFGVLEASQSCER